MEAHLTDALSEARTVAATAAVEEQEIMGLEHEIAAQLRLICKELFNGTTKYRLPTAILEGRVNTRVYQRVGAVLEEEFGPEKQIRVTTSGDLVVAWVHAGGERLRWFIEDPSRDDEPTTWFVTGSGHVLPANDQEIAAHAPLLAQQLIDVLKRRIDTAKDHKATLARVRDAMAGDA